jgi:putative transposase
VLDAWAFERGVQLAFIRPGKPVENAYVESFNGRFRDECLNEHWFVTMAQARRVIEKWRCEYNEERPALPVGLSDPSSLCGYAEQEDGRGRDRFINRGLQLRPGLKRGARQFREGR